MIVPTVQFIQFNPAINPSGVRNVLASGIKALDTSLNGYLDFGNLNISTSGRVSDTKMVIFRASNMGSASGIYNIRFYLSSASAFNAGTYRFLYRISSHYLGTAFQLMTTDLDIPTILPTNANLLGTLSVSGYPTISGIADRDVSQYIYLATYIGTDVPYGTYGGGGAGSFRYRAVYDFS